jgi:putative hydrolase of the HAD superfamily
MSRVASKVTACIFDWGGTLTPWHTIEAGAAWQDAVHDPELARQLAAIEAQLWLRSRDHHIAGSLDEVFATAGVAPTQQMLDAFHAWWDPHTYTDPDVEPLFLALRERGIKIGVLSNTVWPRERHESIFIRDGVDHLIDGAVYTSEIPWTKPHPEAFLAAMRAVGAEDPQRVVFVGDRLFDDIHGAKSMGMKAVHVPHSTIPVEQFGHTDGEPDAVVQRLRDLVAIVDGWS